LHGRLSVPPLYDDVSYFYFLDAIRWMNAVGDQGIAAGVWNLLHVHAPFKGVCLLDSMSFPDVTLRVYRRECWSGPGRFEISAVLV